MSDFSPIHKARIRFVVVSLLGAATFATMIVLLTGPFSFSPIHKANVREFNTNAAKVYNFCGPKAGERFRAIYSPDGDSKTPMQEWVKRCTVGGK
jgi:hypothetical protein